MDSSNDQRLPALNCSDRNSESADHIIRMRLRITGIVQGVGFRPFVYNLARSLQLKGFVRNVTGQVEIEIQGLESNAEQFLQKLDLSPPPLSVVNDISAEVLEPYGMPEFSFSILESKSSTEPWQAVPADAATCSDCLVELFTSSDRRYRYPFINCTNCGPRFTIIDSIPYDRKSTTMDKFEMCNECRQEYTNPSDRRFHAQPNCCPECGPQLSWILTGSGLQTTGESALVDCLEFIREGKIVAVKGLGGFHLVCDARNETAVAELRRRKGRYAKPLAVLMTDSEMVRRYCQVSPHEEKLLSGCQSPIVLLEMLKTNDLASQISPGTDLLGVMLPYTPLHHLLCRDFAGPLVATSGNTSEEPIAIDNNESIRRLSHIACGFLVHNRDIQCRYDDSVTRLDGSEPVLLRRSRGFAPLPIRLPFRATAPVLACGAHLKNTFCLVKEDRAFVSQHIGDLENIETLEHFEVALETYSRLFQIQPEVIACDLHPDYISTNFARKFANTHNLPLVSVQHHHAHIASVMAEHGLNEPVIGVAFDGLGYGTDGTIWGGEFLQITFSEAQRLAHFKTAPQPGGSAAIKNPWRMAAGYLWLSDDSSPLRSYLNGLSGLVKPHELEFLPIQLEKNINCPSTSSCGRLFDAVSALLGICLKAGYEGQAAVELETCAWQDKNEGGARPLAYNFSLDCSCDILTIDPVEILAGILEDRAGKLSIPRIAHKFHITLSHLIKEVCLRLKEENRINIVCLSGGVFQNRMLSKLASDQLLESGFAVYFPRQLPVNDGGISLGQAAVALKKTGLLIPH